MSRSCTVVSYSTSYNGMFLKSWLGTIHGH